MHNRKLYIRYLMKSILAVAAIIIFKISGLAQNDLPDSLTTDTVITETYEPAQADEEVHDFDSLTAFQMPSYPPYFIADTALTNLKKDGAFWYANETPKRQKPKQVDVKYKQPFYLEGWFRTLVWIIIIAAFVAVLVWFLIASDVKLFRRKAKAVSDDANIDVSEDIFAVDYDQELAKAIANDNLRLGVRLMYLHILRLFAEGNIIEYKMEKTNSEYLFQLYNTSYYKDFFRLTRSFEYVWYGKFTISAPAFEMIRRDYTNLKSRL